MKKLVAAAAAHPVLSNLMMLALLVGGTVCALSLNREIFPEFSLDRILVTVAYPGASPAEVEEGICVKIEEAIQGIDGIKRVLSSASEGSGTVIVELEAAVADPRKVQYDIKDKVDQITTFPEDAEEPTVSELLLRRPVIDLVLYGEAPEHVMHELARRAKDDLVATGGISQVSLSGVRNYEISIEVSEAALRRYGLTFQQVADAVTTGSLNLPGGTIRTAGEQIKVEARGRRYTGQEYEDLVVVARPDGAQIRLGQIAKVIDGFEEDDRLGRFNGQRAVLIGVHKTSDEDALRISDLVQQYATDHGPSMPEGLHLAIWGDTSRYIADRIDLLLRNARWGSILVVLVLWVFLSLRLSFWVALGIPVSFGAAMITLWAMGHTLNMLSLFSFIMVLGMVVDDAIVVGENVHTHRQRGEGGMLSAVAGTTEMALPVLAAVATTIVAFVPLLFVSGIMGKFIAVVPVAVIATLVGSTVESLFILPAHLSHASDSSPGRPGRLARLARRVRARVDGSIEWFIQRVYRPAYRLALDFRSTTMCVGIATLLLCGGLFAGGFVKFVMMPKSDTEILVAKLSFPQGTSLAVTRRTVERIELAARSLNDRFAGVESEPIVQKVYTVLGEWSGWDREIGPHAGEVTLELRSSEERRTHSETVLSAWRQATGLVPEARSLTFSAADGGPGGKSIEIALTGPSLDALRAAAASLRAELARFDGVYDVEDDYVPGKQEMHVRLRDEGRSLGVTLADLARQLRQGFYGQEAVRIQRGREEVKVQVRYPREQRRHLSDIETIRIRTASGLEIPFDAVAEVSFERNPATINRQDGRRRLTVSAEVDPAVANGEQVLGDLRTGGFLARLADRYPGLSYSFEGQKQESRESIGSLVVGLAAALCGIYAILALVFRSYLQPLIVMVAIPFGGVGATLGHLILGFDLSMLSLFGMVALAGVVVNDSLVLIDWINRGARRGLSVRQAVDEAGPARFRAITLTSVTTASGLMPMMAERSFQAQYLIPMAISLAFGIMFATLITLFLVPSLYLQLNRIRCAAYWLYRGRWPTPETVEPACRESSRRPRPVPSQSVPCRPNVD